MLRTDSGSQAQRCVLRGSCLQRCPDPFGLLCVSLQLQLLLLERVTIPTPRSPPPVRPPAANTIPQPPFENSHRHQPGDSPCLEPVAIALPSCSPALLQRAGCHPTAAVNDISTPSDELAPPTPHVRDRPSLRQSFRATTLDCTPAASPRSYRRG